MRGRGVEIYLLNYFIGICIAYLNPFSIFSSFQIIISQTILLLLIITFYLTRHPYCFYIVSLIQFIVLGITSTKAELDFKYILPDTYLFLTHTFKTINNKISILITEIFNNVSPYIKALLIGNKESLNIDAKNLFKLTGTLHLLALSGLHTGIIYSIINIILFPIKIIKHGNIIHLILCCLILFTYSFVCGASASILRATIMITIINYEKINFRKNTKIVNLFITAFIILLFSPSQLKEIGFQLSFSAVLGIIYIFPTIKSSIEYYKMHPILSYFLKIMGISIACQISTLPISLYYFGYIAPLFLIANIIAIPIICLIIYLSLITIMLYSTCFIKSTIIYIICFMIQLLEVIFNFIAK